MHDLVLNGPELVLLYNGYSKLDRSEITVNFPFFGTDLFTYDFDSDDVRNIVPRWQFGKARDARLPEGHSFLDYDSPKWYDLKDAFLSSNLLKYQNWNEAKANIKSVMEQESQKELNPRQRVFALDTNIAYNRFVSRSFPLKYEDRVVPAQFFRYVVSCLVREELDAKINIKYRGDTIDEMCKRFKNGHIAKEFFNGSGKMNRKAKSASFEIEHIIQGLRGSIAGFQGDRPENKEDMDRAIVQSYFNFQNSSLTKVILLSCDRDMAFHAKNMGLSSLVLEPPVHIPNHLRAGPGKWASLIHDLIVNFGVLEFSDGTRFLSEWRGKNHSNNLNNEFKVCLQDDAMYDLIKTWQKKCRSVIEGDVSRR